ncbi:hypothetical protein ACLMJK_006249 [Lecanora helva]
MAYHQQPCDSYFVETFDDPDKTLHDELRQRERIVKRETQLHIAEELSQLTSLEYLDDALSHMEDMESLTIPDVASIDIQTEISWHMRPYLLDFLLECHAAFGLRAETFFLAINLVDRYCSRRVVYKKHYQLLGSTALFIAAKYGDSKDRVPVIKELINMCCDLYDDDMFIQMEWHVLQTLDWTIGHPTIDSFLKIALNQGPYDPELEHMALYICEIALFQKEFVSKRPSDMARSSLALARCILGRPQAVHGEWASQYEPQTLVTLSQQLHHPSKIVFKKYSSPRLSRVSYTLDQFLARHASIARGYTAPPTPPAETVVDGFGMQVPYNSLPITPTKPSIHPNINVGCPTPPITPTDGHYLAGQNGFPPTPGSMGAHMPPQTFRLPSIHQIAPGF